jgi:hypothetical protein
VAEQSSINVVLEIHLERILNAFSGISTVIFTNTPLENSTRFKDLLQRNNPHSRTEVRSWQFFGLIKAISKSRCNITKINIEGYLRLERFADTCAFGDDAHIPGSIKHAFPDFENARCWEEKVSEISNFLFLLFQFQELNVIG